MSDIVTYSTEGRIGLITLNRPDARNAINGDVARGVEAAIDQLEADDSVWVGILTANTEGQERPVFCAGADLKAINSGQAADLNTKRGGFAGLCIASVASPSSWPSTGSPPPEGARSCWPPTSSSPPRAPRSVWPR